MVPHRQKNSSAIASRDEQVGIYENLITRNHFRCTNANLERMARLQRATGTQDLVTPTHPISRLNSNASKPVSFSKINSFYFLYLHIPTVRDQKYKYVINDTLQELKLFKFLFDIGLFGFDEFNVA